MYSNVVVYRNFFDLVQCRPLIPSKCTQVKFFLTSLVAFISPQWESDYEQFHPKMGEREKKRRIMKALICTETFSSFAPSHSILQWPNRNLCTHCNRYFPYMVAWLMPIAAITVVQHNVLAFCVCVCVRVCMDINAYERVCAPVRTLCIHSKFK